MRGTGKGKSQKEDSSKREIDVPVFVSTREDPGQQVPPWQMQGQEMYGQEMPGQYAAPPARKPSPKKQRNRVYVRVAYLFSAMFLSLVGYLVYFNLNLSEQMLANPNNHKMEEQKQYVVRGSIFSSDGEILAGTDIDESGNETRVYPYGNVFAHVVGYTTNGKAGVEAAYNADLLTSSTSIVDQVEKGVKNEKVRGNSLILTLDAQLQQAACTALGSYRGAVVVLEPSTGRILAMVSKPDFDPNAMAESWEYLISQDAASPLLNRAVQGLYPPGSTFKILTALAYIRQNPNYASYRYNCTGYITNHDVTIQCYDGEAHGEEDLQASFQHSCNTSFANIGLGLDMDAFAKMCGEFLFNRDLPTLLTSSESQFRLTGNSSYGDIMTTSIGQGDTLVTPFHMALIAGAVANGGVMMRPYLVERVENADGAEVQAASPSQYKRLMTAEEAGILKQFMQSVVEGGTASAMWNGSYTVAGKTGSAEYEVSGSAGEEKAFSTHSWFVGFSNVESPDIVVCVLAEDGGTGSAAAVPIAKAVFDSYYAARVPGWYE